MKTQGGGHCRQTLGKDQSEQLGPEGKETGTLDGTCLTSNVSPYLSAQGPVCFPKEWESLFYPVQTKHVK